MTEITKLMNTMHESISKLYKIAIHDEKTGVYNNKFFESMLDMEVERVKREKQKLSLIMVDIDFFKKVNDTYGHIKADELLARLALVMKKQARKYDIVARFGGEEFVILLPGTAIDKAKKFSSRLKKAIHSDKILKKNGITVSGGISQFREKRDSKINFKKRADKALYSAKNKGRDRFEILK